MNFDESVNKILHEAYFSSPNEKMTGIKRHVEPAPSQVNEDEMDAPEVDLDDTASSFMQRVKDSSSLQGTKIRVAEGLHQSVIKAIDAWLEAGSPSGKRGADVLIDSYLESDSGVMLSGDETHVHDLMKGIFAMAYATGVKNESLANSEAEISQRVAQQTGGNAEDIFEARWQFHFQLDPTGIKPAALTREEKAAGITTKRQGKPLMSAERFRNILQQAQLKLKKGMDVQKAAKDQDMGDQDQAKKNLDQWKQNSAQSTAHFMQ